ncbi:hypothetical protein N7466_003885 [Penicillium verhagenii]|uniref:uncharacterized protein n=1 Tax=Penicillium verhagenii TaxID=1562060 RepID=UPI002545A5F2|nr:uncharacterized protein N7466_003885 [Penicillium verhagenii]KAJ5934338.1 hypothetical protein N7466_003885 [Penicillium verhagenii]
MRFSLPSLLGLYGVLSATAVTVVHGEGEADIPGGDIGESQGLETQEAQNQLPNFMSVRPDLAKAYDGELHIPKAKYFTALIIRPFDQSIATMVCTTNSFLLPLLACANAEPRYANETLPDEKVIPYLSNLIQTYLETMNSIGAETWIMHGTLLSWWWNQKIFPWDNDLDVQISEPTIHFLAEYYNFTDHHFEIPGVEGGRTYLLEINPNYIVKSTKDRLNVIDGRWIDKSSGLFIDITAVRPDDEKRKRGYPEALMCKDRHHYDESDIFPLRVSYYEDVAVKIPYAYAALLAEEYGASSMTKTDFQGHHFSDSSKMWEKYSRKVKRFLRRGWRGDDTPKRSGTEPLIRMDAI